VAYSSDLTDDAIFYVSKTGCQWRMQPAENGCVDADLVAVPSLDRQRNVVLATRRAGQPPPRRGWSWRDAVDVGRGLPQARGASSGGVTFGDRGGKFGSVKGAKRVVAVDVTGLPVAATVVSASTHDNGATTAMLDEASWWGTTGRLELVLVDRGVTERAARSV